MTALERPMGRRKLLLALGIAAGAAYVAPAMLQLSEARASSGSSSGASNSFSGASRSSFSSPGRSSGTSRNRSSASFSRSAGRRRQAGCRVSFSDGRMRLVGPNCPRPPRFRFPRILSGS